MITNEKQFSYSIEINGEHFASGEIDDPFITSRVVIKGWQAAWDALTKGIAVRFHVTGTRKAIANVFSADYTPFPDGPSVARSHDVQSAPPESK